jgi:hypothetical protein
VLAAGVKAQRLVPGSVAVGGTAAALYAHHRVSEDTDHLLPDLKDRFDEVREALERSPDWRTNRVQGPVLILGNIEGVQVGFRQARRTDRIETTVMDTAAGPLVVPTLDEMIGMKAYMLYSRNAVRDYLDFAALSQCTDEASVLGALLKSDQRYGHLQTSSAALEIAKRLAAAKPYDLGDVDLARYKGLTAEWRSWSKAEGICRHFGALLGSRLTYGANS